MIIVSAFLWCIVAICYRRRRARELQAELAARQALRERQERELLERSRQPRRQNSNEPLRLQRNRQAFVNRHTRSSSQLGEVDLLTINVALSRGYIGPPSYSEAVAEAARDGASVEDDPPPPYTSIYDGSNDGGANPV
jgi:hypothetical protein